MSYISKLGTRIMPAIQPAQLKIQAAELAQKSTDPDGFCRELHDYFDSYSDRIYRPGQVGEPRPLIRAYHVPQPVINAILRELVLFAHDDRETALALIDALWLQPNLEFRLLAASLIGQVSPTPAKSILERIQSWMHPETEERLVDAVINYGLERMRNEQSESYIQQVKLWLKSQENYEQSMGLKAICQLVADEGFEDFPMGFALISPLMQFLPTQLRPDILDVIEVFASRSSKETAYFLEHMIQISGNDTNIAWIVRHSLEHFPQESQDILWEALRKSN